MSAKPKDEIAVELTAEQSKLLAAMLEPTRELAMQGLTASQRLASGTVMTYYRIGSILCRVEDPETKHMYQDDALQQLTNFIPALQRQRKMATELMRFAREFDSDFVTETMKRPFHLKNSEAGGSALSLAHWLTFARISDPGRRTKAIEDTFKKGLSAKELGLHITKNELKNVRTANRKPARPESFVTGIRKLYGPMTTFNNLWDTYKVSMPDLFENTPDAEITPEVIEALEQEKQLAETVAASAKDVVKQLSAYLSKAKKRAKG